MNGWGEPPRMAWHCADCQSPSLLEVLGTWDAEFYKAVHGIEPFEWRAARCTTCDKPYVFQRQKWAAGIEAGWNQTYPTTGRTLPDLVPRNVRFAFYEAQNCLAGQTYAAAVLMARRAVEAICDEHGVKQRNLKAALQQMKTDGHIDGRLYDWSDLIREVGNEGAHEHQRMVCRADAREILAFVEALIDYVYVFGQRYDEFVARRATPDDSTGDF